MSKTVYIIPGLRERANTKIYREIGKSFKSKGINPVFVNIKWGAKNHLIGDYVEQFIKIYKKTNVKGSEVYMLGFSAGGWISFMAALKINPKKVFLCSFSPYFKEDMGSWSKSSIKYIGNKCFNDFKNYNFNSLVKQFKSKAVIFVGEKEPNVMHKRSKTAHKAIKNSKLVIVPNGKHDIRQKAYLESVKKNIK